MFKTILYIGIPLALYAMYNTANKAVELADNLTVRISGLSLPKFGQTSTIPLQLSFHNPVDLAVTVTNLVVTAYVNQSGNWIKAAFSEPIPSVTIQANSESKVDVAANVILKEILPFKGVSFNNIIDNLQNGKAIYNFKIDVSGAIGGVPLQITQYQDV